MGILYHYTTVINSWSQEEDLSYQQEKGKDMNALNDADDPELAAMAQMIMEGAFFAEPGMAALTDGMEPGAVPEQLRTTEVILFVSVFFLFLVLQRTPHLRMRVLQRTPHLRVRVLHRISELHLILKYTQSDKNRISEFHLILPKTQSFKNRISELHLILTDTHSDKNRISEFHLILSETQSDKKSDI